MARNLLTLPSVDEDDYLVNLADWVEATAIFSADRNASREDLKKALSRDGDSKDERAEQIANDVFTELEDRAKACGESGKGKNNYPFSLDSTRTLLTLSASPVTDDVIIYIFLLAITRGDMSSSTRKMAGVDPTKVFERMCADVLLNFWGGQTAHSDSLIFGTARPKTKAGQVFPTNITNLCEKLKEGGGWKNGAQSAGAGDGKLDVAVWRRFSDERDGGLIGFAQCKTGVNWEDHLTKLNPESFSDTYFISPLALHPVRVYMVPCRISAHKWRQKTKEGGLLMDRCRITQYSHSIDATVKPDCRLWLDEAMKSQKQTMKKVTAG